MEQRIGVVGGTGPMGRGLSLRFAAAGMSVVVGSRDRARAGEVVGTLRAEQPQVADRIEGAENSAAVRDVDLVVVAAPWAGGLSLAPSLAGALDGLVVISVANALTRSGSFLPITMPRGSVTAELAARLPGARVVGAFHHLPAGPLADLDRRLDADVLVVGEDPAARTVALDLVDAVEGLRGVDGGGLEAAGAVEALTAVLVGLNVRYRTHSTLRLGGALDRTQTP